MTLAGLFSLLLLTGSGATAQSKDSFYFVPIDQLELTTAKGEKLPPVRGQAMVRRWDWRLNEGAKVYGAAGVEAYLLIDGTLSTEDFRSERFFGRPQAAEPNFDSTEDEAPNARARNRRENLDRPGIWLAIRVAENKVPAGRLVFPGFKKQHRDIGEEELFEGEGGFPPQNLPNREFNRRAVEIPVEKLVDVTFRIKPKAPREARAKEAFWMARQRHFLALQQRGIPGAAWFRFQANQASAELKKLGVKVARERDPLRPRFDRGGELEQSFDFFSGGRALSENLQLERELRIVDNKDGGVAIDSLPGIDVKEMDWKKLIAGKSPKKDSLAGLIPADQHAMFFTSFTAMRSMLDEIDKQGVPVLGLLATRSEDTMTFDKYGDQLCLPLGALGKLLGPAVIDSMAFTGSDSYLLTGSDLAVLFEAKDANVLTQAFKLLHAKAKFSAKAVRDVRGEVGGVSYTGVVNPDRTVCAYVAVIGSSVIVSNSLAQLEKIAHTAAGKTPSLAKLDEYTFFRDRYAIDGKGAGGFLVITDAAIRRWCGARWRIAASRRTRAAAALSELQAVLIAAGKSKANINQAAKDRELEWLGQLEVENGQVVSAKYGSLRFLTPISELDFYYATPAEARAYRRFRDNYQREWRQFFDPIAVEFAVEPKRIAADITVMPLILESEYNEILGIVGNKLLPVGAGDPHQQAVLQYLMALDMKSKPLREVSGLGERFLGGLANPLGWVGGWVSIYIDDSPLWKKLDAILKEDPDEAGNFLEEHIGEIPLAFNVEVKSHLRLAAVLVSLRALIKEAAPEGVQWQTRKHKEKSYTAITSEEGFGEEGLSIYYAITPRMLTISLNEKLIQQVIERSLAPKDAQPKVASLLPGRSLAVRVNRKALSWLETTSNESLMEELQMKSWDNIPILNEWKKRGVEPVAFHARYWHTRLICPGGGKYRWNEKDGTMESTVFGHPERPLKNPPASAHPLHDVREVRFGLTFEHDGLRAQGEVLREVK
jgi:hypothetical protein